MGKGSCIDSKKQWASFRENQPVQEFPLHPRLSFAPDVKYSMQAYCVQEGLQFLGNRSCDSLDRSFNFNPRYSNMSPIWAQSPAPFEKAPPLNFPQQCILFLETITTYHTIYHTTYCYGLFTRSFPVPPRTLAVQSFETSSAPTPSYFWTICLCSGVQVNRFGGACWDV